MTLPAAPSAAITARSEVTRRLAKRLTVGVLEDVKLLLTELITNALRHSDVRADDQIGVKAELSDGTVRIEVHDPGRNGPVAPRKPGAGTGGGYGLYLVESLTSRWASSGGTARRCGRSYPPARLARLATRPPRSGCGVCSDHLVGRIEGRCPPSGRRRPARSGDLK